MSRQTFSFKIRTMLLAVGVLAIGLAAYPVVIKHLRWSTERNRMVSWAENLKRSPGQFEVYWCRTTDTGGPLRVSQKSRFAVATSEPQLEQLFSSDQVSWVFRGNCVVDSKRFFVMPPGKWVNSIDEVIPIWEQHFDNQSNEKMPSVILPSFAVIDLGEH